MSLCLFYKCHGCKCCASSSRLKCHRFVPEVVRKYYVNNNRFIYINCVVNIYHCVQNRAFCTPLKKKYIASVKFPFKAQIEKG